MKPNETLMKWTRDFVEYMDLPPEERRNRRIQLRAHRKAAREPWKTRWFGQLPIALAMWLRPVGVRISRLAAKKRGAPSQSGAPIVWEEEEKPIG
ncbi:YqzE family protein [Paenibacillus thermoaerophilus]|uniref:YqzE family protein n=1 Tax=Paenibacillus thermoaerophilus TaxID=1215385 RepID=A0ABW2V6Q5_9BACL|nr:YqzE family protein [Paenibacillus thermoaerophilus]TMV18857.1 YqzE family protein [Paenibacillus thermoaerophilus]